MSGQFPGERWDRVVTRLVQRRRILALLDRLEAQAERVELLDLPNAWTNHPACAFSAAIMRDLLLARGCPSSKTGAAARRDSPVRGRMLRARLHLTSVLSILRCHSIVIAT